jgi:hypothetical protein
VSLGKAHSVKLKTAAFVKIVCSSIVGYFHFETVDTATTMRRYTRVSNGFSRKTMQLRLR